MSPKLDRFASLAEVNVALNIAEVKSIIIDRENNLWAGTEAGLYMFNRTRDRLVRFGQANGLRDANNFFYNNAAIRSKMVNCNLDLVTAIVSSTLLN
jgi:ligand-binding sensor domain-containing protein